jgi:hypothetical protein
MSRHPLTMVLVIAEIVIGFIYLTSPAQGYLRDKSDWEDQN